MIRFKTSGVFSFLRQEFRLLAIAIILAICSHTATASGNGGAHRGVLPGDDCFSAFPIGSIPFSATGDSCEFSDASFAPCPSALPGSPDVVYQYTPASDETLTFSLCNPCTNYDAQLYIYDSCPATGPIACSEGGCSSSAFPDFEGLPVIPDLQLTANTTYYIVIDGNDSDCGIYDLTIEGPPIGACCQADGNCVDHVPGNLCSALGSRFYPNEICGGASLCPGIEPGDACGSDSIFGPGFGEEDEPFTAAIPSDVAGGAEFRAFEGFWGLTSPIDRVTWWGTFLNYDGNQFNGPCQPNPIKTQFVILFHQDNGGIPGAPVAGPFQVNAQVDDTGIPIDNGASVYECTAVLPQLVNMTDGWISIAALDDPQSPNCVHQWINHPDPDRGDEKSILAVGGPFFEPQQFDLSLCLSTPRCGSCAGDLNGDGFANGSDIQTMVGCAISGPSITPGCGCSDLNTDRVVDLEDAALLSEFLIDSTFPNGACPPLFTVDIISGALPDSSSGADLAGAARGYDGVPIDLRLRSDDPPSSLQNLTLAALSKTGGLIASYPLTFFNGESQVITIPAGDFEDIIHLNVFGSNVPDEFSIYRIHVEAGPVATFEYVDTTTYLVSIGGPFNTPPELLNVVGIPGECGSAGPLNITSAPNAPDDPFSGEIGTMDVYTFRMLDAEGRPCRGQKVELMVNNPSVLGIHPLADAESAVKFRAEGEADESGSVHMLVDYCNAGSSGVTATPQTPPGPPMPVPGPGGGPANFTGTDGGNNAPVIRVVAVAEGENGAKVNDGVKYTGGILNYGVTYCIEAKVTRYLSNRDKVVWCINGMPLNDAEGQRVEGKIAYIRIDDPDPNAENRAEIKLTSKIIRVNGQSQETVRTEETNTFTVTEKITLQLCVIQFASTNRHPSAEDWAAELKRLNEVYTGTGVCFTLQNIRNINGGEKGMNSQFTSDGKAKIGGKLVKCICDDETLHGSRTKITIFTGINGQGYENGEWKSLNGNAMGADEVVKKSGAMADYEICGKFANTIAVKRDKVNSSRATVAHELGHILGCEHHNSNTNNLMCQGSTRKTKGDDINPEQAKTIRENAKKIKNGQCD